jgi:MFS family permease
MTVSIDSWGTGFDSSLMSAMNANDRFHSDLGIPKTGGYLGIVTAIYTIGNLVGSFFAGPASDRFGRRIGMFIGATIVLMGAIVVFTAKHSQAYMAGRFFIGFGVSVSRSAAPAFVTEISPPQWRGPVTCCITPFGSLVPFFQVEWPTQQVLSSLISPGGFR